MSRSNPGVKANHREFCDSCFVAKRVFIISVLRQHPHFTDTGTDIEVLSTDHLISAYTFEDAREIARKQLTPPNIDPSLITFQVEALYTDELL